MIAEIVPIEDEVAPKTRRPPPVPKTPAPSAIQPGGSKKTLTEDRHPGNVCTLRLQSVRSVPDLTFPVGSTKKKPFGPPRLVPSSTALYFSSFRGSEAETKAPPTHGGKAPRDARQLTNDAWLEDLSVAPRGGG